MQLFTNNAASKLASNISAVSLSLQVKTGEGAKFPSPTGGDFFLITLSKVTAGIETAVEIVKCTARTGDALTVVRAQEGTTANAYLVDDRVELRMTAGTAAATESHINNTSNPHAVTKAQVGLGNVDNTSDVNKPISTATQTALDLKAPLANPTFTGTVSGITKAMVGLGNVDNTSDANKPVSTAQQTALNAKAPLASPTFTGTVSGITKAMVGLGNVDNTSDTNKPVSTATQTALDLKAPLASPTFTGTVSGITKAMVGLSAVENTALSTWAGTANITTVGTVATGTWNAAVIADGKIASALTGKTYNGLSLTAAATGFTLAGGTTSKTLTVNNTLGLSGTDGSTLNIGTGGTLGSAAFVSLSSPGAIGNTTPSTGAFTTLSASGSITAGSGSAGTNSVVATTTAGGGNNMVLSASGTAGTVGTTNGYPVNVIVANSTIGTFSPSGLAVTGALSATSFSGAGSGLTGTAASLNIGGNAATSSRTFAVDAVDDDRSLANLLPSTAPQAVNFRFVNAAATGTGGAYAGVMTFSPYTGTTASTGDASYQLAFGGTAFNAGGVPQLRIRKGIDSTWNSWIDIITSANYSAYSPTLTGSGASGTWGISVTGSSASCTGNAATATTATNWNGVGLPTAGALPGTNGIPRADLNGFMFFNYINSNTANSENGLISQIITTNGGDGYYRKSSVAHLASALSGSTMNINGNATTATNATTQANGTNNTTIATTAFVQSAVSLVQPLTLGTAVNTTSGTSINFTGIPSWVKRITLMLDGVSTSGTSNPLVQLGTSGGVQATGYKASSSLITTGVSTTNYTAGFGIATALASNTLNGTVVLTLMDAATGKWSISGVVNTESNTLTATVAGVKSLSGTLDRLRLTTVNGTDTFDAGSVNIMWE